MILQLQRMHDSYNSIVYQSPLMEYLLRVVLLFRRRVRRFFSSDRPIPRESLIFGHHLIVSRASSRFLISC
jgi:hypothetical protein